MTFMSPPRRKAVIAFIFVTAVLDIMAMGIVMPVLPVLIEQFIGSNAQAGVINGIFVALWAGMQFVAAPVVGSLSDQYGRRPVLLLSAIGLSIDYVLMAVASDLWWLAFGRIIAGITTASFTTIYAYMADITAPENRARAYGLIGAAFSGGFIAGPLLGGVLGEISPRAPFWAAAALSGLCFVYGLLILPESLPVERRMAFSWKRANPLGAMVLLRSNRELFGLAAVTFLLHFAHHVFSAVYVLYAGYRYGWSPWEVGFLLSFAGVLDMIVQGTLIGPTVKRFGDRTTMVMGLFGGAVGIACMGWAPTGLAFALALVPNAMWGLAMPTSQSLMTQRVGESEQGQLQGASMSVASIAGVISPLVMGSLYGLSVGEAPLLPHPGTVFFIAALVLLAAAIIGWKVARRAERDDASEK